MKRIDYKTAKWDKKQKNIIKYSEYNLNRIEDIQKQYDQGEKDIISFYFVSALAYIKVAEYYYVAEEKQKFMETIEKTVEAFRQSVNLLKKEDYTFEPTKSDILKKLDVGNWGYFAFILGEEEIGDIADVNSSVYKMVKEISSNCTITGMENIVKMQNAIVEKNSTDFNEALNARMIELRKFSLDYYICVDFFSLGLIRYALKKGLSVDGSKYIEADLSYLEME